MISIVSIKDDLITDSISDLSSELTYTISTGSKRTAKFLFFFKYVFDTCCSIWGCDFSLFFELVNDLIMKQWALF